MMPNQLDPFPARRLSAAMVAFAAALGLHGFDHLRRGMAASPPPIMVGGLIQGLFVAVAAVLVLSHHRWAGQAAIVSGFGSALVFTYAHLLPTFLPGYQDSFVSGPRINVTWFSWLTAVAEIAAGLVLGFAGVQARRCASPNPSAVGRSTIPATKHSAGQKNRTA